jgi:iron complex transport system ATP-binding protein
MRLEADNLRIDIGARTVISDVSICLRGGEFVGLIGANGAGKSTLLRALAGVTAPVSGAVRLDDRPLAALNPRERARAIAWLPQGGQAEPRMRGRDIVSLGRYPHGAWAGGASEADRSAVQRALEATDALAFADRPAGELSGGERARILLARALAVEAPILLADEPAAALDPYHQIQVMEILEASARAGRGVLAIVHDIALAARFMDRIVVMVCGGVAFDGAPHEALSRDHLLDAFQVETLSGREAGKLWVLPWTRADRRAAD